MSSLDPELEGVFMDGVTRCLLLVPLTGYLPLVPLAPSQFGFGGKWWEQDAAAAGFLGGVGEWVARRICLWFSGEIRRKISEG
jgi:hypothetical protein